MIDVYQLTKRFGDTLAVDDLTFSVQPGVVTGFLGPNGSGKSTTMRLILGLNSPDAGTALVNGVPYHQLRSPLREVGALLDAKAVHPGRSARQHLRALAQSNNIPLARVETVLEIVGLSDVANRRTGTYSLGMSQRLGIAAALLGDPQTLMFDEPINGLDPEGIRWVREFFQQLAREGRTVLVSSHLMSEMALTANSFIIIGKGRLITTGSQEDLARGERSIVRVASPNIEALRALAQTNGWSSHADGDSLILEGPSAATVGDAAFAAGIPLHELTSQTASLEDIFMELTADAVEYVGKTASRKDVA